MRQPKGESGDEPRHHPYTSQPDKAFWRRTVQDTYPLEIRDWYARKFSVAGRRLATGGSCFAQHIGREMKRQGHPYLDVEPAPGFLPADLHTDYGYGIYSARYGNIYTSRQLLQLIQRAFGEFRPAEAAWRRGDRFVDPFRPGIEPDGLESPEEVDVLRRHHLARVVELFEEADLFVFTLGMTETWMSLADGAVFPVAPGTAGGVYDPSTCRFLNLTYPEIVADLEAVMARLRSINARVHFIFTVSPVSIMATGSRDQVVVANTYSKSVLRAVAGYLAATHDHVDYFPGYEITTSPPMRSMFYNPDLRTVSAEGVRHVMKHFFAEHAVDGDATPAVPEPARPEAGDAAAPARRPAPRVKVGRRQPRDPAAGPGETPRGEDDGGAALERVLCDEELAAAFGKFD